MTAEGACYELPVLTEWKLRRTGGVPCDSFTLRCAYAPEMAEVMGRVYRVELLEEETTALCGVLDAWRAAYDETGAFLTLEGRGLAALLLDNEAEAATYQSASLREILRDQAEGCGIVCAAHGDVRCAGEYAIASGTSRWKAIEGFARRCGLTPYFTCEGTLHFRTKGETEVRQLAGLENVTEASYRDRRYGVLSEVTVVNRSKVLRRTVRNEAFLSRGGMARRVIYAPSRSVDELRYTGEYQIEKSAEDARVLTLTAAGGTELEPLERVWVSVERLGVAGTFRVSEVTREQSERGETTQLTLWEE